jgi:hypothetical protein
LHTYRIVSPAFILRGAAAVLSIKGFGTYAVTFTLLVGGKIIKEEKTNFLAVIIKFVSTPFSPCLLMKTKALPKTPGEERLRVCFFIWSMKFTHFKRQDKKCGVLYYFCTVLCQSYSISESARYFHNSIFLYSLLRILNNVIYELFAGCWIPYTLAANGLQIKDFVLT